MGLVCRWFGVVKFLRVIRYDIVRRLSTVIRLLVFHFGRRSVVASSPQPLRRFSRSVLSVLIPRNLDFASSSFFLLHLYSIIVPLFPRLSFYLSSFRLPVKRAGWSFRMLQLCGRPVVFHHIIWCIPSNVGTSDLRSSVCLLMVG